MCIYPEFFLGTTPTGEHTRSCSSGVVKGLMILPNVTFLSNHFARKLIYRFKVSLDLAHPGSIVLEGKSIGRTVYDFTDQLLIGVVLQQLGEHCWFDWHHYLLR